MKVTRYRYASLFLLLAVLWGISFTAIKTGLGSLPPIFFAALRADVATPILLIFVAYQYDVWLPRSRADYTSITIGALTLIAANNGFLFLGQQSITPAAASVLYGLNPILSPIFAFALLDKRLDALSVIGIVLGLIGVIIIVQPSTDALLTGSTIGQFSVLAAAASVALGSVLLRRVNATIHSIPLTAWAMGIGASILHAVSYTAGESLSGITVTPTIIYAVLVVGVLSTAIAYPVFFTLIRQIGPIRTNLVAYVVPVFAAITAWILFGETVTLTTSFGFLVVVAGVGLIERHVVASEIARAYQAVSW